MDQKELTSWMSKLGMILICSSYILRTPYEFCYGVFNIKLLVFFLGTLLITASQKRKFHSYSLLLLFYIFFELISYHEGINVGSYLLEIATSIVYFLIFQFFYSSQIRIEQVVLRFIPIAIILFMFNFIEVYTRFSPFNEIGAGTPFWLRSHMAYFSAIWTPLSLIPYCSNYLNADQKKRYLRWLIPSLVFGTIAAISFRVRTAWLCLIFEMISVVLIYWFYKVDFKKTLKIFFIVVSFSVMFFSLLPNKLAWTSDSPYMKSFSTMTSLNNSSGRNFLWAVGLTMFRDKPLLGVGAGNSLTFFPKYTSQSGVNPKTIQYINRTTVIFNDYLDEFVKLGVFGGLFFLVLTIGFPFFLFFKRLRSRELTIEQLLSFVSLGAVMIISFFNNIHPYIEIKLPFFIVLAILLQKEKSIEVHLKVKRALFSLKLSLLLGLLILLSISYVYRTRFMTQPNKAVASESVKRAYLFWPWDKMWNRSDMIDYLYAGKDERFIQRFMHERLRMAPDIAHSYLHFARYYYKRSLFTTGFKFHLKGMYQLDGGRCSRDAQQLYKEFEKDLLQFKSGATECF